MKRLTHTAWTSKKLTASGDIWYGRSASCSHTFCWSLRRTHKHKVFLFLYLLSSISVKDSFHLVKRQAKRMKSTIIRRIIGVRSRKHAQQTGRQKLLYTIPYWFNCNGTGLKSRIRRIYVQGRERKRRSPERKEKRKGNDGDLIHHQYLPPSAQNVSFSLFSSLLFSFFFTASAVLAF